MRYLIERVDISSCWVKANSKEDAIDKSNDDSICWDISVGQTYCVDAEEDDHKEELL